MRFDLRKILVVLLFVLVLVLPSRAQETLGAITGTVIDTSGAVIPNATVKAVNLATNLEVVAHTNSNGSYLVPELPGGTYKVSFTKDGFKTETHTQILVNGNRTTTVDATLAVGAVSSTVEVTAVPLMNETDTTNGYVVDHANHRRHPSGHRQLHATGDSEPGRSRGFSGRRRLKRRPRQPGDLSPTGTATPATAFP